MRAGRIAIPDTAFSVERSRTKRPRVENRDHLAFIRLLPCAVCGMRANIQAAHIRARSAQFRKRQAGTGEKSDDRWTLPLCAHHHILQHDGDELAFWDFHHIDPFVLALALFGCSGNREEAEGIIAEARRTNAE